MSKLNLDRDKIDRCRELAESIAHPVQKYIDLHSTVSIERSVLRLFGMTQFHEGQAGKSPLCQLVVDRVDKRQLSVGIATLIAGAKLKNPKFTLLDIGTKVANGELDLNAFSDAPLEAVQKILTPLVNEALKNIDQARRVKEDKKNKYSRVWPPARYVVVATGNIDQDIQQALTAAKSGADIIAVVRSKDQNSLDYVPHGATVQGESGTYATQENFRLMRQALDVVSEELGRYIRLSNDTSGLCMSEIAVMGAAEHLDYLVSDSMHGILFADINMKRTFVDQYFSRLIMGRAGIIINTGEDNYLNTDDVYQSHHQVLASQFINEQFSKNAGLKEEQIGLGHSFEMDPKIEDSFIYELAMAQLVRDVFPRHPIKFMPPSKQVSGDAFYSQVLESLFNLAGVATNQQIQLLGMPAEVMSSAQLQNSCMSLKSANYIFNAAGSLYEEIQFNPNGKLIRRARTILDMTMSFMEKIKTTGLMDFIEQGFFANRPRAKDGGKGLDGVFQKSRRYYNPFLKRLLPQTQGR